MRFLIALGLVVLGASTMCARALVARGTAPLPHDCIASLAGTWTVTGWNWSGYAGVWPEEDVSARPPSAFEFGSGIIVRNGDGTERIHARVRLAPSGVWMEFTSPGTRPVARASADAPGSDENTITEESTTVEWRLLLTWLHRTALCIEVAADPPAPELPDRIGPLGFLLHEDHPPRGPESGSTTEAP